MDVLQTIQFFAALQIGQVQVSFGTPCCHTEWIGINGEASDPIIQRKGYLAWRYFAIIETSILRA
jgi:hypothetical protein